MSAAIWAIVLYLHLLGPILGVPKGCRGLSVLRGASGFGGGGLVGLRDFLPVSRGVSRLGLGFCGGVDGRLFARARLLRVRGRGLRLCEEEASRHLIELGVVRVSHPNNPALAGVGTGDGAHLYPGGVGDVDGGPNEWIVGTSVLLLIPPPFASPSPFSSPLGLGAGVALVFGGRGGLFFFLRGGRAPLEESGADSESDSSSDSKRFLLRLCLGFGLGLVLDAGGEGLVGWGGGFGCLGVGGRGGGVPPLLPLPAPHLPPPIPLLASHPSHLRHVRPGARPIRPSRSPRGGDDTALFPIWEAAE